MSESKFCDYFICNMPTGHSGDHNPHHDWSTTSDGQTADAKITVHMQEVVTYSREFTVPELANLLMCKPTAEAIHATIDTTDRLQGVVDVMVDTPDDVSYTDREWGTS